MNTLTVLLVASLSISGALCQIVVSGTWELESLQTMGVPTFVYPQGELNQQLTVVDPSSIQQPNVLYYVPQASPFAAPQNPSVPSSLGYPQYVQSTYGAAPQNPTVPSSLGYPQYVQSTYGAAPQNPTVPSSLGYPQYVHSTYGAAPQNPTVPSSLGYPQYVHSTYGAAPQNPTVPSSLGYPQYVQPTYGAAAPSPQKLFYVQPQAVAPGLSRFFPTYPSEAAPLTPCQLVKQMKEAQNQAGQK